MQYTPDLDYIGGDDTSGNGQNAPSDAAALPATVDKEEAAPVILPATSALALATTALPQKIDLPADAESLIALRDDLEDYLSTIERNTEALNAWLATHGETIIDGYHKLLRAIVTDKSEKEALRILSAAGEAAGFILDLTDFETLARTHLGEASEVARILKSKPETIPSELLEDLPALNLTPKKGGHSIHEAVEVEVRKVGFWSGLFNGKKKAEKEAAEERTRREQDIRDKWVKARAALISLQSNTHYYVDSFMESMAETLAPLYETAENDGTEDITGIDQEANIRELALRYQEPAYVVARAQEDFLSIINDKIGALREEALRHSAIASALDKKDPAFTSKAKPGETSWKLLMQDSRYKGKTIAEIALNYFTDRAHQLELLQTAAAMGDQITLTGKSASETFHIIMKECLADTPLSPQAIDILRRSYDLKADYILSPYRDSRSGPSYLRQIADRFGTNEPEMRRVMAAYGRAIELDTGHLATYITAVNTSDLAQLKDLIATLSTQDADTRRRFLATFSMCYPDRNFMDTCLSLCPDKAAQTAMILSLAKSALADDLKIAYSSTAHMTRSTTLFEEHFLSIKTPVNDLRTMIASLFVPTGTNALRELLVKDWMGRLLKEAGEDKAAALPAIAALLEPFESDFVRANILFAASKKATGQIAQALKDIEKRLASTALRSDAQTLVVNFGLMANIWHDSGTKTISATANGETRHVLADNIDDKTAAEALLVMERLTGFTPEYGGLWNTAKIDRITITPTGDLMASWQNVHASVCMNVSHDVAAHLQNSDSFIRGASTLTGETVLINTATVTAIEPLNNGDTLVIDKYGYFTIYQGTPGFTPAAGWVNTGEGGYFNPLNAEIIMIDRRSNTLNFLINSADFDALKSMADLDDALFYNVPLLRKEAREEATKILETHPAAVSATAGNEQTWLNLSAAQGLTFINQQGPEGSEYALEMHKYGVPGKTVRLALGNDVVQSLYDAAWDKPSLVTDNGVCFDPAAVSNIFHDDASDTVNVILPRSVLKFQAEKDNKDATIARVSRSMGEVMPLGDRDVLDLSKTVGLTNTDNEPRAMTETGSVGLGLDSADYKEMINTIEKTAIESAATETWSAGLRDTLASFNSISIERMPAVYEGSLSKLFEIACDGTAHTPRVISRFTGEAADASAGKSFRYSQTPRRRL